MPHRRLTGLPLALLAPAALAACSISVAPESIPAPFSIAPVPSASAGRPAYVCTAVYKILTDGALKLAADVTGSSDAARDRVRGTLAEMASEVTAEGAKATDAEQRQAVDKIAGALATGSRLENPKSFVDGDFPTLSQNLDGTCT